ncbi:mitochondrial substrate carrier family protein ucpB-like [Watersipora subatra]|uniref:mitochondrial substrate carrier family protein ucpB-like n=1 Tax=Watersipora subatra TaxID=2589382 RepID=UPI00355C3C38
MCQILQPAMHPMDLMKTRLQLDNELSGKMNIFKERYYKGPIRGAVQVARDEGILGLYKGLSASMLRELSYSSIRSGTYEPIKIIMGGTDRHDTPMHVKMRAGALAGLFGSAFTTPTDIAKVRLQADGARGSPRLYKGPFDCFQQVYRQHGWKGLYTGATPNVIRAICLTSMQFPVYDHTKHLLLNHNLLSEGLLLHFLSSLTAGLASAVVSNPVDIVKTRIMNQRASEAKYVSPVDVFIKTLKSEGPLALFKGTTASWFRLGPAMTVFFIVYEQLRNLFGVNPI